MKAQIQAQRKSVYTRHVCGCPKRRNKDWLVIDLAHNAADKIYDSVARSAEGEDR